MAKFNWYRLDIVCHFNDGRESSKTYAIRAVNRLDAEIILREEVSTNQHAWLELIDTNPLDYSRLSWREQLLADNRTATMFRLFHD